MTEITLEDTQKTSRGLTRAMFEELDLLRRGESTPHQARAKASVANAIIAITRLEIDFARYVSDSRSDAKTQGPRALTLG